MLDRTVEPEVYNNLKAGSIVKDIITKYTNDITTTNVDINNGSAITRITFNQLPVYDAVKQLANLSSMNFYVDTDKDLHFEILAGSSSGSTFDNSNVLSSDFRNRRDTCYNQVWVYGDRYLDGFKETFTAGSPLNGSIFTLLYKPHNTEITVSGGTIQPGEIKGISLNVGSEVKYLVSYDDRQIIFTSGTSQGLNIPSSGNSVVINYKRSLPIIKVGQNETSITQYGQRNKVIIDKNIKDPITAEAIMKNELELYSDPLKEGNLYLKGVLNITPGQTCIVNLPREGVSGVTYDIVEARYDFTTENLLNDSVVSIKVNRDLPDLTDTLKDVMLGLKKVQAQDMIDTDLLTRYQFAIGSIGLRTSGIQVFTRGIGSSFILGHGFTGSELVGSTFISSGTYSAGLKAYWRFEEGTGSIITEDIGAYNGSIYGNTLFSGGIIGSALSFAGSPDFAKVTQNSNFTPSGINPFSVSFWAYPNQPSGGAAFVGLMKRHGNAAQSNGSMSYAFYTSGLWGSGLLFTILNRLSSFVTINSTYWMAPGSWHHIAGLYNTGSERMYLYINGSQQGGNPLSDESINYSLGSLLIGARAIGAASSPGSYLDGRIDDLRYHDYALDIPEIRQIYESGLIGIGSIGHNFSYSYNNWASGNGALGSNMGSFANPIHVLGDYRTGSTVRFSGGYF